MNPICRTQLNNARTAAGGRPLTDAQAANIEARLSATMRRLARQDPQQWMATPPDQRMLLVLPAIGIALLAWVCGAGRRADQPWCLPRLAVTLLVIGAIAYAASAAPSFQ